MAEKENILSKLGKLFQSNIIVRKRSDGKLVVKDLDFTQTSLTSNFIDRYAKIVGSGNWGSKYAARQNTSNYDIHRRELFQDYEVMDSDPIIASALDIYSDESTTDNMEGEIITIKSDNPAVVEILNNLFYNILNLEFNLWSWIRNLVKYGDFYLWMDILDEHGVMNVRPISPYEVVRLEDHDPENPKKVEFELQGDSGGGYHGSMTGGRKLVLQDYEVAHFRLASDSNFLPYGKSMLESARKVWKQLTLMEDAMMIHRIMRAPEKRIFKIDIGNIPPNEVDGYMQKIINKMKKIPVIDQTTGEYNLRYNVESVTEDYYLPVRGSDSGTSIDTLPGLTTDGVIDDIEYIRNKMMAALKIPKAFLGYEEGVGCVVPETEILLLNGEIKTVKELIEDYENGIKHYTYSIDTDTNMIVPGEIEWAGYTKKDAKLVRVNLDNDKYIDCTPDHRFLTRDGGWVEAKDLQENQSLMPLYLDETTQKNKQGYTTVYHPGTEKYQEVHRLVAEHYDMVHAGSGKVVHHQDFQKQNNYPENFDCSMDYIEHRKYHSKLIEKTLNSPKNIAKRVKEQKKNNHFEIAGRKGGLKSADKLVRWLKENGPWNKGKLSGKTKKCVECKEEFYTEPHRNSQKCCSSECSTEYYIGNKRYNTKFIVEYDELVNVAKECNSFKDLENKLGGIDRNTLNRIFEYNNIDKVDFIFNNMPVALKNKSFMQNYRKYEEQYLNHRVVSVEFLMETKDTCDLTINKYHNFATNAGVIIHNSKATLAAEDVRFARTIERLQKIIVSELHKIAIVHLKVQGFDDVDLIDFDLELQNPSMIHMQEKLELMTQKNDLATSLLENKMVSREWVYKHIFEFDKTEQQDVFDQIIEDQKQAFRMEQIVVEGNDPAQTGEKDMSSSGGDSGGMFGESSWGGSEKNPKRHDINPNGPKHDDLKQATSYERERYGKRDFKHGSPLHPGKGATLVKSEMLNNLQTKFNKDFSKVSMLNEDAVIED